MIIPTERLSAEALQGLIEEFVSREGTDYGVKSYSFDEKCRHVRQQLESGLVVVVFDAASDSCNLLDREAADARTNSEASI